MPIACVSDESSVELRFCGALGKENRAENGQYSAIGMVEKGAATVLATLPPHMNILLIDQPARTSEIRPFSATRAAPNASL